MAKEWIPASIREIRPNRQAPAVLVLSTQISSGHLFCHKGCRTGGGAHNLDCSLHHSAQLSMILQFKLLNRKPNLTGQCGGTGCGFGVHRVCPTGAAAGHSAAESAKLRFRGASAVTPCSVQTTGESQNCSGSPQHLQKGAKPVFAPVLQSGCEGPQRVTEGPGRMNVRWGSWGGLHGAAAPLWPTTDRAPPAQPQLPPPSHPSRHRGVRGEGKCGIAGTRGVAVRVPVARLEHREERWGVGRAGRPSLGAVPGLGAAPCVAHCVGGLWGSGPTFPHTCPPL